MDACGDEVLAAVRAVRRTLQHGGKLLICGNGGSAAASQHLAAEFVGALEPSVARRGLPAVALTTDTSIVTAIGNDFGLGAVFERQVKLWAAPATFCWRSAPAAHRTTWCARRGGRGPRA